MAVALYCVFLPSKVESPDTVYNVEAKIPLDQQRFIFCLKTQGILADYTHSPPCSPPHTEFKKVLVSCNGRTLESFEKSCTASSLLWYLSFTNQDILPVVDLVESDIKIPEMTKAENTERERTEKAKGCTKAEAAKLQAQSSNSLKAGKKKKFKREGLEDNAEDYVDSEIALGENKRLSHQMAKAYNPSAVEISQWSLAGYHRMSGFNALWVTGMDHAGIATQIDHRDIKERTLLKVPNYEDPVKFGVLTSFACPFEGDLGEIVVATLRVETILGIPAIAIHPDEKDAGTFMENLPFIRWYWCC
ncbi:hypothetical protein ACH5RR_005424 [Cinchona calisaya]|uniref:valine--tRNA ligase n=1 Tax=Cinchona calisaya TaxID=153742 RepID=A0ABD3ALE1_9GENT